MLTAAIAIGLLAFAYGVLGLVIDRRQILLTLRAVGMHRSQVVGLLLVELAVPLVAAVGMALVTGLAVGLSFAAAVGNEIHVPWQDLAYFLAAIALCSMLALVFLVVYVDRMLVAPPERTV